MFNGLSVRIDSVDFKVKEYEEVFVDSSMQALMGQIKYADGEIKIDAKIGDSQKIQTLMHEIVHGMIESREIKIEEEHMESVTEDFSNSFVNFIRDNKELVLLFLNYYNQIPEFNSQSTNIFGENIKPLTLNDLGITEG